MISSRAPEISGNGLRWRAGLTLAERLSAVNAPADCDPKRRVTAPDKIVRWRMERRADIARTRDPAAIPLDPPSWLRTFRAAYADAARAQPSSGFAEDFLTAVEPVLAGARR